MAVGGSCSGDLTEMVPVERIELPTFGLQNRCSTAELNRLTGGRDQGIGAQTSIVACPPHHRTEGAPSNTRVVRQGLQPRNTARPAPGGGRAGWYIYPLMESGWPGGTHGGEAAVHGGMRVVGCSCCGTDPRRRGRSGVLQAICPRGAGAGAGRAGQSALRRGAARRALVGGVFGSLRMVPWRFARRRGGGTGCAHASI